MRIDMMFLLVLGLIINTFSALYNFNFFYLALFYLILIPIELFGEDEE